LKEQLYFQLGEELFEKLADQPLSSSTPQDRSSISQVLGRRLQNQAYRELFLRVISDQWVDYLTRVEALRVSVGMESYGQRDPLVQYKSQATDMFKSLLADIRMGIIGRLFTYQPRITGGAVSDREQGDETLEIQSEFEAGIEEAGEIKPAPSQVNEPSDQGSYSQKKKRKRH
jgi:preprotein translocase subunit SecA